MIKVDDYTLIVNTVVEDGVDTFKVRGFHAYKGLSVTGKPQIRRDFFASIILKGDCAELRDRLEKSFDRKVKILLQTAELELPYSNGRVLPILKADSWKFAR